MTDKELKRKAMKVIFSCTHPNQLLAAERFCDLVVKRLYPRYVDGLSQILYYDNLIIEKRWCLLEMISNG